MNYGEMTSIGTLAPTRGSEIRGSTTEPEGVTGIYTRIGTTALGVVRERQTSRESKTISSLLAGQLHMLRIVALIAIPNRTLRISGSTGEPEVTTQAREGTAHPFVDSNKTTRFGARGTQMTSTSPFRLILEPANGG